MIMPMNSSSHACPARSRSGSRPEANLPGTGEISPERSHAERRAAKAWRAGAVAFIAVATGSVAVAGEARTTLPSVAGAHDLSVDFGQTQGKFRALHGVNNGPLTPRGTPNLTSYFKKAGIPISRLHDGIWSGAAVVDIPFLFPLAHLDPADPANYHFARTDDYVQAVLSAGAQIVYRLGTSIEPSVRKYDIHPPRDYDRWATICVNVIRHYNEGWADGFHHNIRYWEIWNEPDNPAMWTGTPEQFYRLYAVTAQAIKRQDATLKVGGPGVTGKPEFVQGFLNYCREQSAPVDFFSWHTYSPNPLHLKQKAEQMRRTLDEHGFKAAESHLNEWHYFNGNWKRMLEPEYRKQLFEEVNGPAGAAFNVAALLMLQDTSVDVANYYSGDTLPFGMFDRFGVPHKTYYAFEAFGRLLATPQRLVCAGGDEKQGLVIGAGVAADRQFAQILLANFQGPASRYRITLQSFPWAGQPRVEVLSLDETHNLATVSQERLPESNLVLEVECPKRSVLLIRILPE
jgi:hypothetical protein